MNREKILAEIKPHALKGLKAPGSAIFCSPEELVIKEMSNKSAFASYRYLVTGWVDAQNSFGALLRTDLEYIVEEFPDGSFIVVTGGVGDNTPTACEQRQLAEEQKERSERFGQSCGIWFLLAILVIFTIVGLMSIKK